MIGFSFVIANVSLGTKYMQLSPFFSDVHKRNGGYIGVIRDRVCHAVLPSTTSRPHTYIKPVPFAGIQT